MPGGLAVKLIAKRLSLFGIGHPQQFKYGQIKRTAVLHLQFRWQTDGFFGQFLCAFGRVAGHEFLFHHRTRVSLAELGEGVPQLLG